MKYWLPVEVCLSAVKWFVSWLRMSKKWFDVLVGVLGGVGA